MCQHFVRDHSGCELSYIDKMDEPDNEFNCCQCWFPLPATATTLGVNVFQQAKNKLESGQNSKFGFGNDFNFAQSYPLKK